MMRGREDFRQWLVAREPDEIVGHTFDPYGCPLRAFLLARGCPSPSVTPTYFRTDGLDRHPLPRWARDFVNVVDPWEPIADAADWEPRASEPVTAKEALTILDGIDP